MFIDDEPITAELLPADEARAIYNEIVRQYRDPALLEYVGKSLIQANIFPIPGGDSRRIEIVYRTLLESENGLVRIEYPFHISDRVSRAGSVRVQVNIMDDVPVGNVYSPGYAIAATPLQDGGTRASFEASNFAPSGDFALYYSTSDDAFDIRLLTYQENPNEDGFFLLMVQPPRQMLDAEVQPKDVVVVVDQSGSMDGEKMSQARDAASYVLGNLNPRDRFSIIAFSSGWQTYASQLQPASAAGDAQDWVSRLTAEGGTNIHDAMLTAFEQTDTERPLTVLFLTDGLATEGIVETREILASLEAQAPDNLRIFTFGVGYDVDTNLLDLLAQNFGGDSAYVQPNERIDDEVTTLYNRISAPVMTDVSLAFDGLNPNFQYPAAMPDLFLGQQVTVVGRYRAGSGGPVGVSMTGTVDQRSVVLNYEGSVGDARSGNSFIASLWATRRIGELLNSIRLNGGKR